MEVGGRDKIMPSPSLRRKLNPIRERVMKETRFRKPTQRACRLVAYDMLHTLKERIEQIKK
jgi:uracil phosphoribosyltransferase